MNVKSLEDVGGLIDIRGTDECWPWLGNVNRQGYGLVHHEGKLRNAHRVVYALHFPNAVRPGVLVCHSCDNPPCCNVAHLFTGDYKANRADAVAKGRMNVSGEGNGMAKLSDDDVRLAWSLKSSRTHQQIGDRLGVARSTITNIFGLRRRKHSLDKMF
jgi:hypothetical protein